MRWIICPRCELNYIQEGEKMCSVCRKEVRGEQELDDMIELCSECGEHPAVPGGELCVYCLKERSRQEDVDGESDEAVIASSEAAVGGIDSVSSMEEIELDLPAADFDGEEAEGFDDEDDEDEDEDDLDDEEEDN